MPTDPTTMTEAQILAIMQEAEVEIPAAQKQILALNQTIAALNSAAASAPSASALQSQIDDVNAEAIKLNNLLGNPITLGSVPPTLPPAPTPDSVSGSTLTSAIVPNGPSPTPAGQAPVPLTSVPSAGIPASL